MFPPAVLAPGVRLLASPDSGEMVCYAMLAFLNIPDMFALDHRCRYLCGGSRWHQHLVFKHGPKPMWEQQWSLQVGGNSGLDVFEQCQMFMHGKLSRQGARIEFMHFAHDQSRLRKPRWQPWLFMVGSKPMLVWKQPVAGPFRLYESICLWQY